MRSNKITIGFWIGCAALLVVAACGGVTTPDPGASSAGSGTGGATATSSASGSGGSMASTGTGGAAACSGLLEPQCLAASPDCAPVYDDTCCPSCDPGPCADCSNYAFHHCAPSGEVCKKAPSCGQTPIWACAGTGPSCPSINDPGGEYQCDATPGCVIAACSPDVNCIEKQCHAVTPGTCTATCESLPPSCPAGLAAEADGNCFTGFCIPTEVCGP